MIGPVLIVADDPAEAQALAELLAWGRQAAAVVHVGAVTFGRGESPGLAAGLVLGSAIRKALRLAYLAPPGAPPITEAAYNTLPAPPSARPWPPAARLLGLPARALVEGAA